MSGLPEYDYSLFIGGSAAPAKEATNQVVRPETSSSSELDAYHRVFLRVFQNWLERELQTRRAAAPGENLRLNGVSGERSARLLRGFAELLNFWPEPVDRHISGPAATIEEDLAVAWTEMFAAQPDLSEFGRNLLGRP